MLASAGRYPYHLVSKNLFVHCRVIRALPGEMPRKLRSQKEFKPAANLPHASQAAAAFRKT